MLKCWIFAFGLLTNNDTVNVLDAKRAVKKNIKIKWTIIKTILTYMCVYLPYGEFWHRVNCVHVRHSQTNPIHFEVSCSMFAVHQFGCSQAWLKFPERKEIKIIIRDCVDKIDTLFFDNQKNWLILEFTLKLSWNGHKLHAWKSHFPQ